jgi:DNA-binding MarR family transcriptional regulator
MSTEDTAAPAPPAETRWLDDDEQRAWRDLIDGTVRLQDALARAHERRLQLSLAEYELLVRLAEASDGTLRMSRLADGLAYSRSRVTHTVRRMEEAGYVRRLADAGDGRGVNCRMTPKGRAALVDAAPTHVEIVRTYLVDVLDRDELLALGNAMARIAEVTRDAGVPPRR